MTHVSHQPSGADLLLFDLGNVIVRVSHAEMARALGEGAGDTRFHDPHFTVTVAFDDTTGLTVAYDEGRLSTSAFYQAVTERLQLSIDEKEFARRWNSGFHENHAVSSLISRLHRQYRLFLLSNTNELHYLHLQRQLPVLSLMEQTLLSYQLGMRKPARALYEKVIALAGVPPDRIIYIDDIPAYVEAARDVGIRAIRFESASRLIEDLRNEGVECDGPAG